MFSENGKISLRQLQCLIISDFIVVYILLLPYFFMKNSVCGIILKFLLSFLFGAVVLYFCTLCAKRKVKNGGENVLKILCIFLLIKTLFINGLFINIINSAENIYLSAGKNSAITICILTFFSFYLCVNGIESRGRLAEISAFFIIIVVMATVLVSFFKCNIGEGRIAFCTDENFAVDTIKIIPFLGSAESIFFILPYVETNEKNIEKSLFVSFAILSAAVIFILFGAVCFFGEELMLTTRWQAAEFMKNMSAGFLPQRQNILFTGVLLFGEAMYWAYSVFFSAEYMCKIFPKLKFKKSVVLASVAVFISVFLSKEGFIYCSYTAIAFMNVLSLAFSVLYILKYGGIKL